MGMLPHRWNRSWEIVRGVTHPDFRGSGLATELAQRAIDDAWASDDCDLVVGFPRNRTMYRILSETVMPAMKLTGHAGVRTSRVAGVSTTWLPCHLPSRSVSRAWSPSPLWPPRSHLSKRPFSIRSTCLAPPVCIHPRSSRASIPITRTMGRSPFTTIRSVRAIRSRLRCTPDPSTIRSDRGRPHAYP